MISSFSTTAVILDINRDREILTTINNSTEYSYELYEQNDLLVGAGDSTLNFVQNLFKTYITFVKGDFSAFDDDYYLFSFYGLETLIINVTLLNLVVS